MNSCSAFITLDRPLLCTDKLVFSVQSFGKQPCFFLILVLFLFFIFLFLLRRKFGECWSEILPSLPVTPRGKGESDGNYIFLISTLFLQLFCSFLHRIRCYRWRKWSSATQFLLEAESQNMEIFLKRNYKLQSVLRVLKH